MLKAGFQESCPQLHCILMCGCELSVDCYWHGVLCPKCDRAVCPICCRSFRSSISIHSNLVVLSLEIWLANCACHASSITRGNVPEVPNLTKKWGRSLSYLMYIRPCLFKNTSSKSWNSSCRNCRCITPLRHTLKMKWPVRWPSQSAHHTLTVKCSS